MRDAPPRRRWPAPPAGCAAAETGRCSRKEIEELLGRPRSSGVGLWIDLVRVPPSGTWERRRADLYAAAEDWVGAARSTRTTRTEHARRRYLGGFGPASASGRRELHGAAAGRGRAAARAARAAPLPREDGESWSTCPRAPLPDPDTPAPPRFLPTWDATLLVHARRTGVLPEEHRPQMFSIKTPHSFPTFLVDGAVAGTWKLREGQDRASSRSAGSTPPTGGR